MADRDLSSDLEMSDGQSASTSRAPARRSSKSRRNRASSAPPPSAASDQHDRPSSSPPRTREEKRRHRILDRQCDLARQRALASTQVLPASSVPAEGAAPILHSTQALPAQNVPGHISITGLPPAQVPPRRRVPEATYTPTAAGLRPLEGSQPPVPLDVQSIVAATVSSLLATGSLNMVQPTPPPPPPPPPAVHQRPSRYYTYYHDLEGDFDSVQSDESNWAEDEQDNSELSEDETPIPDRPAPSRLFRPALFKSLLHKAKVSSNLVSPTEQQPTSTASQPSDGLFSVQEATQDTIPCPQLFTDVVQKPWGLPGSLSTPTGLDKKLYCSAPNLQEMLQLPIIDAPVAQLSASASLLTNDVADGLRTEDRRAEVLLRKNHQAAAWAIRAATSSSFFNRASLIWLRQLKERLPPDDKRLHQDINKLVAAAEYSADASLDAAKFASRSLTATVASRRLLWLRQWRADNKSKWQLASVPFKGPNLFGEALTPILVEDRDKRKVMPSSFRRSSRRYAPYSQRPPFRAESGPGGSYQPRSSGQSSFRPSERSTFRDRGGRQASYRRPFRGTGGRPFRRGK